MEKQQEAIAESKIEERFGNIYNHPSTSRSTLSINDLHLPHRHLTKWYLTRSNDEEPIQKPLSSLSKVAPQSTCKPVHPPLSFKRRYALPDDFQFTTISTPASAPAENEGYFELHGYMVPSSSSDVTTSEHDLVPVVLSNLLYWEIDTSFEMRGIWVKTKLAWYYLKDPCHSSVLRVSCLNDDSKSHLQDPYLPSQYTLNLHLRAKMGLLSNILDLFSERKGDRDFFYAPIHAELTVEESYKMLCLDSNNMLKIKYANVEPPLNNEPFDLNLLKQKGVAAFIKKRLLNYHEKLSEECTFIKSLNDFAQLSDAKKTNSTVSMFWRDNDYRKSAEIAEKCSGREMWCEPRITIAEVCPNRLLELETGYEPFTGGSNDLDKEEDSDFMKKEVEGTAAKILGDETNHIFVMTEQSSFDENMMEGSISLLSNYLSPIDKTKRSDYTNFAVQEGKVEELLQTQVLNDGIISLETMLLVVSAISQSSNKVLKSLFKIHRSEDSGKSPASLIFRYWLSYVIDIMERRRHRFSRSKPKSGEVRTEELITAAIMELIVKFRRKGMITMPRQIDTVKSKYNVDWVDYVEKTLAFVNTYKIVTVIPACKMAKERLDEVHQEKNKPITSFTNESLVSSVDSNLRTSLISDRTKEKLAKLMKELIEPRRTEVQRDDDTTAKKQNNLSSEMFTSNADDKDTLKNKSLERERIKSSQKEFESSKQNDKVSSGRSTLTLSDKVEPNDRSNNDTLTRRDKDGLAGLTMKSRRNDSEKSITDKKVESDDRSYGEISTTDKIVEPRDRGDNGRLTRRNEDGLTTTAIHFSRNASEKSTAVKRVEPRDRDDNDRLTRRDEDGLIGIPMKSWRSSSDLSITDRKKEQRDRGDNDRLTRRDEDGLAGIPMKSWRSASEKSNTGKNVEERVRSNNDRLTRRDEDGLAGIMLKSWRNTNYLSSKDKQEEQGHKGDNDRLTRRDEDGLAGITLKSLRNTSEMTSADKRVEPVDRRIDHLVATRHEDCQAGIPMQSWAMKNFDKNNKRPHKSSICDGDDRKRMKKIDSQDHSDNGKSSPKLGRGRGRGNDINKPAWMTRQESTSNVPGSPDSPISHKSGGKLETEMKFPGRGRGRGKNVNKPAWMTNGQISLSSLSANAKSNNKSSKHHSSAINNSALTADSVNAEGIGRGKHINKPAWMTAQQGSTGSFGVQDASSVTNNSIKEEDLSSKNGRGRGKHMNKPAWMMKQQTSSNISYSSTDSRVTNTFVDEGEAMTTKVVDSERGKEMHISNPAWMMKPENGDDFYSIQDDSNMTKNKTKKESSLGNNISPRVDNGGGRGRGKHINKPAWMERHDSEIDSNAIRNQSVSSGNNGSSHKSSSEVNSTGRGRGKHVNKPAWMTTQKSRAVPMPQSNFNNENIAMRRGRGRDINKPAWMTMRDGK